MLSDIVIYRDVPIVANFVQPAGNYENGINGVHDVDAMSDVPGSQIVTLSGGFGRSTGGKTGVQRFLRMPGITQMCCAPFTSDPIATIKTPKQPAPDFPA